MKHWRSKLTIGALVGVILIGWLVYSQRSSRPEPSFRGKRLTRWLKQLDDGEAFGISSSRLPVPTPAQREAARAVVAMGPEAFPLLMEDLHARPDEHALRFRFWRSTDRLLMSYFHLSVGFLGDVTAQDRIRWRAAQGLSALGPLARPALPELQRLLFTNFFHSSVKEAAFVLASIGPEGVNILTNAPNVDEWAGMCAIWALGQHPAAGTNAIEFLVRASSSSSEGTACGAIQVLGLFHTRPERVVPALMAALASPSGPVRSDAARALGEFGQAADSAVVQLRALASDPSAGPAARAALDRIEAKKTR